MSRDRIPQLDALRGIAILLVLGVHYFTNVEGITPGTPLAYLIALTRLAWSGVDLFFVLSGFLIGGILIDARDSENYFRVFYVRRFLRILPLYAVTLACYYLLAGKVTPWLYGEAAPWWSYVTLTQNFWMASHGFTPQFLSVTWSLAIEEQFYLTLPLLIRFTPSRLLPYVALGCALAAPLIRTLLYTAFPSAELACYVLMPCRMDALMLGVWGAWYVRNRKVNVRLAVAVFTAGLCAMGLFTLKDWNVGSLVMSTIGYSVLAVTYLALLLLAVSTDFKVFRLRPLTFTGIHAYGLYLFHLPVRAIVQGGAPLLDYRLSIALFITFVLAWASWKYFEGPLVRLSHGFRYQRPRVAAVV